MFATLFLGAILAVFLTLNAVRGDAERGLLQPMLVRPLSRGTMLLGRFAAAAGVCMGYVLFVFLASVVLTNVFVDWWPDRLITPALELAVGVGVIAALALGGSVVLSSTANGIAIFMLFGAGLTAGLLGQIGEALDSETLEDVSRIASWILPFEALYQTALSAITADTFGFTRFAVELGPFGGAQEFGALLWPYTLLYLTAIGFASLWAFRRRDL
jgi:ABC-type transport system involved in multi-copper enzyme maturation permease subunit